MNHKGKKKQIKFILNITRRLIALLVSLAMLIAAFYVHELDGLFKNVKMPFDVYAANPITENYPINSLEALYDFSNNYANDPDFADTYKTAALIIDISGVWVLEEDHAFSEETRKSFVPIGNDDNPFMGQIVINQTESSVNAIQSTMPFFGVVCDSVEIVNANLNSQKLSLIRTDTLSGNVPLFANSVRHDDREGCSIATWDIMASPYVDESHNYAHDFSGIIGTVEEDAEVDIIIDFAALAEQHDANIISDSSVGLVCGTMEEGSTVNVTLQGSSDHALRTGYSVTTSGSGAAAGSLVGEMGSGTSLNVYLAPDSETASQYYDFAAAKTISATGDESYAGGLVGYNNGGAVNLYTVQADGTPVSTVYSSADTVKASKAAGGIFGYYLATSDVTFNSLFGADGCQVNAANAGGFVGILDGSDYNVTFAGTDSSTPLSVDAAITTGTTVECFGCLVGKYLTNSLEKTLDIAHVEVTFSSSGEPSKSAGSAFGGLVGFVDGSADNHSAAYVKMDDISVTANSGHRTATYFGGLVGKTGNKGSLLDAGSFSLTTDGTYNGGGVVGYLDRGVLRLSGETNLSSAVGNTSAAGSDIKGQIVGKRGASLVYALGTGSDSGAVYDSGWNFTRYTNSQNLDDIGTWGEVVRIPSIEDGSVGVLTYNTSAHTVTVSAPVLAMASTTDVVKTALNMQLNSGSNVGALCFADTANKSSVLLASNSLTVSGEISLSGTGITSLTRDDGSNNAFSGTLSGASGSSTDKIVLATGESYGVCTSGKSGTGEIYAHKYNGLFAKVASGTISNLSIGGTLECHTNVSDVLIGGITADITNGLTATNVVLEETINYKGINGSNHFVGGLAGRVNLDNAANKHISVSDSDFSPIINASGSLGKSFKAAGGIAYVDSVTRFNMTFTDNTLSYKINGTGATSTEPDLHVAGLIADIKYNGAGSNADTRKVILSGNTFSGCEVKNNATTTTGGLLGHTWFNTDTEMTNNTFSSGNMLWTDATTFSALCHEATGYWQVKTKGLKIDSLELRDKSGAAIASNHVTDFGFIVNKGYYTEGGISAIYLETQTSDSYSLDSSGVIVPSMTSGIYDEFVAHTGESAGHILENNNGVISICLPEAFKMNGTECNSYQNVFNQSLKNGNSRYYYNVAAHKSGFSSGEDGWKLLIWSLNRYASANIQRCFTSPFSNNTLSGTFNMDGISYYPVDIPSGVTVTLGASSGTSIFTFRNEQIEKAESVSAASGNTDGMTRTTLGESQHFLMHSGLFRVVNGSINAAGAVSFAGSVGKTSSYSGVLVNSSLGGSFTTTKDKYLTFNNLSMHGNAGNKDDTGYLLIHSMGSNSSLTLNSVRISGYPNDGTTYASSLIGDVVGTDINLRFSDLKIDGRNATGASNSDLSNLDTVYGTKRSIFTNATLLNKYDVNANSVAIYNYTESEDWTGSTHTGKVTYGREITDSVEYLNLEKKYYASSDDGRTYTNPVDPPTTSPYTTGFSSDFLPYVRYFTDDQTISGYTPPSEAATYSYREIKVNVLSTDLSDGCGTYDHPYVITSAKQLQDIATMINGRTSLPKICLPKTVHLHSDSSYDHWCLDGDGNHTCSDTYSLSGTTYTSTDPDADSWTTEQVREYLCGAYYQIQGEIDLNSTFVGLGATSDNADGKYAFRGVIIGASGAKIINKSPAPLIKVSNGSVVKNLEVEVNTTSNVATDAKVSYAFSYGITPSNLYYGGVIGEIMGGDNIIDNVKINYDYYLRVGSTGQYLYTVGGYVGALVNGGLVFRNMPENPLNGEVLSDGSFLVGADSAGSSYSKSTDYKHLYINPFVGRVINGYAINETDSYSGDSGEYTLDNSAKNYRIADVDKTSNGVISFGDFTAEGSNDKLCIPDGQSLFILSLITQSGAGSAPAADGDYAYGVAYDGTVERYDTNSAAQYAATHLASYDYVGNVKNSDDTINDDANDDWTESCRDRVDSTTCVPYIISKYTSGSGESYLARTVTSRTYMIELTNNGGDYKLPECFRGIGSICRLDGKANGSTEEVVIVNPADLNDEDGKFVMKIYGLKGNNSKIWIGLNYKTYSDNLDNYIYTVYESTGTDMDKARNHIGFGLFNYVKQIPQSGNDNTTFNTTSGYYIGDFTLTGKVDVKEYNSSGNQITSKDGGTGNDKTGKNFRRYSHSVGGVIGVLCIDDYANLVNADMDDITISGPYMVGGYIGRVNITERNMQSGNNMNYIFANGCDTEKTIIKCGGGHCGGIVAGSHAGYMSVYVNTATNSNTSDTKNRDSKGYYKSSMEVSINNNSNNGGCGTSGVIGGIRNGHSANIWINNLDISGYYKEGVCEAEIKNTSSNYKSTTNAVGGYIGYVRKAESVIITNSSVSNTSINGQNAGGLFGYIDNFINLPKYGTSPKIKIYNCDIYADNKTSGYSITSAKNAGGITGGFITDKTYEYPVVGYDDTTTYIYDIDGVNVYNYTISGQESCGGLIGTSANGIRSIVNSSVHDCTLRCGSNSDKGMGGIVGIILKDNTSADPKIYAKDIYGYNISSYNNVFAGLGTAVTTSAQKGNFIGITNSKNIKIVAFSRKNNIYYGAGLNDDCGTANGSDGYIICSDYRGVCETASSANKTPSNMTDLPIESTLEDVGPGARDDYFSYANVNPRTNMGKQATDRAFLTSDGAALYGVASTDPDTGDESTSYSAVVKSVVDDKNGSGGNNSSLYDKGYTGAYSGTDSTTNGAYVKQILDASDDADVRITTYGNEMGLPNGYQGDDFPVIALGGADTNYDYTKYIQSYIRLMTNTTDTYTSASSSKKYNIKIWPCRYNSDTGQYSAITDEQESNKSIYISNSKYLMRENKADTLNKDSNQFTLIDVQFLNPMNDKEVAYHLFVPVLTQKMAKFDFHSDVKQGTDYVASDYDRINVDNTYAGNFDNWTTAVVQFKYTAADINTILNSGRGLMWNSDKVVTFNYTSDKDIADSTQFVLLDTNNNVDKAYYLNKTDVSTTTSTGSYPKDTIEFSKFKAKDGSTGFTEQLLNDLAGNTIRYTQNNSGGYYEVTSDSEGIVACAYDSNGANVKFFARYENESGVTRYDLTATEDIVETYYLSMYAYSKDNKLDPVAKTDSAYAFTVSCPTTLDGEVTSRKRNETNSTVYIGDMFTQTLEYSNSTPNVIVSKDNNILYTNLTSTVRFADSDNKNYFQNKLSAAGFKLYQGFLVDINKHNDGGAKTGSSRITQIEDFTWTISSGTDPTQSKSGRETGLSEVPYIYIEPVQISIPSATENPNWSSTQYAMVSITFTPDDDALADEFMSRMFTESRAGNNFFASANLDFTESGVEYSSMRQSKEDTSHRYYMQREEKLDLMLTAEDQMVADEYDKFGEQSDNFSSLGVNSRYINTGSKYAEGYGDKEHIEGIANIDLSSLPNNYLDGNHALRLTCSLNQKRNSGASGFTYNDVYINTYLNDFKLISKDAEITSTEVVTQSAGDYIYTFPLTGDPDTWLINYDEEQKLFDARVAFDVITADDFEADSSYLYSNYKLDMTAEIVNTQTGTVVSSDLDWIVYTHAKVNAQFVSPSEP